MGNTLLWILLGIGGLWAAWHFWWEPNLEKNAGQFIKTHPKFIKGLVQDFKQNRAEFNTNYAYNQYPY